MMQNVLREKRLILWDRLLRGAQVSAEELDTSLTKLARDVSEEERAATVLLLAIAQLSASGTQSQRLKLLAVLRYYFSQIGSKDQSDVTMLGDWSDVGLIDLMGQRLSWPQAMRSVGRNEQNYTDLTRTKSLIKEQCRMEWLRIYGPSVPAELEKGR